MKAIRSRFPGVRLAIAFAGLGLAWCPVSRGAEPSLPGSVPTAGATPSTASKARDWWAFQPLRAVPPPTPRGLAWAKTPVDRFVLARLESEGRLPAHAASRHQLIRRASLDLLGLPPTPGEVEAFEKDPSPEAWPNLVDRLLDRPEYGERWARHWLDVARFAESSGFEHDYDRPSAYHYRDFVIQALNRDLPYDDFVRWQLAGDEFAPNEPLALMATGFLGAGVFPTQITANEVERTRYDALDDMLSTVGTAMLGLTLGCARCHEHKFDPISTTEYYRMLSTFTTTVRSELELDLDPEKTRRERQAYEAALAPLAAALHDYETQEQPAKFAEWLRTEALRAATAAGTASVWQTVRPVSLQSKAGATFKPLEDGSYLVQGANADSDRYTLTLESPAPRLSSLRLEALADPSLVRGGPGRADNGNIGLSRIRVQATPLTGGPTNEVRLEHPRATFEQNATSLSLAGALDDDPHTGWAIDPRVGTNHVAAFAFATPVAFEGGTRLVVTLEFAVNTRHNLGRFRLALGSEAEPALEGSGTTAELAAIWDKLGHPGATAADLSPQERAVLLDWWRPQDPAWRERNERLIAHRRSEPKPALTKVLTCTEGNPAVRMHTQGADFFEQTYQLHRGSTDQKRGIASPGFLQALMRPGTDESTWRWDPPAGAKYSGRRRSFANWITDLDRGAGPLLARVAVNRLWQHHFGVGLVATPNDFGVQGARPSHPELLDWLALELVQQGWHLKPLHRLLMTSAAYQLSSRRSPEPATSGSAAPTSSSSSSPSSNASPPPAAIADYSHFRARRLEAETARDCLLAVCGVLDPKRFGPGTLEESSTRRSIYFTVKRSRLIASMQAFDAPEPLVSQGTRPTTTVAPQALFLMNSPQVRQWAGRFAERLGPGESSSATEAVERAYRLALSRPPTAGEVRDGTAFIEEQREAYRNARQPDPTRLALTDFAQVILGLNEFIYVE